MLTAKPVRKSHVRTVGEVAVGASGGDSAPRRLDTLILTLQDLHMAGPLSLGACGPSRGD